MSAFYHMVKLLRDKPSLLAAGNEGQAIAALQAWNRKPEQKRRKLYINGHSFPKRAAIAIKVAKIFASKSVETCTELQYKAIAKMFRGELRPADAAIEAVVLYADHTATSRTTVKKHKPELQPDSWFCTLTASDSDRCTALLQISILFRVLYTPPKSSPAMPDCRELAAAGGPLHPSTAMPLAAVLLYVQALSESLGGALGEVSHW
jgi:hypothetical protein